MIVFSSMVITVSQVILGLYGLHAGALLFGFDQCGPYHNAPIGKAVRAVVLAAAVVVLLSLWSCGPVASCAL